MPLIFGDQGHKVTHFCGAPVVHGMLINAPDAREGIEHRQRLHRRFSAPRAVIEGMERMGFEIPMSTA